MIANLVGFLAIATSTCHAAPPNVVLVMTDDQGLGDLSVSGNPILKTPHIDRIAAEGARCSRFYVSPVCTPTRACLMTGRYNFRTRAIDTYLGRAMMEPDEVTLAEALRAAGYATGIFGKWHLGDNYPLRPMEQGFDESFVHKGGGLRQPSAPPGGEGYFDPILFHNGAPEKTKGYCTDLFFDAALDWIDGEAKAGRPFFAYIATNAPHGPLDEVPAEHYAHYKSLGIPDDDARVFAMIANIDDNVGRLLDRLDQLDAAENTLVIYLHDNGIAGDRSNMGLRGQKGTTYEGGIRAPCFIRWPAAIRAGTKVQPIAAHIDLMPTILDACGTPPPDGVKLDGRSLLPLLRGEQVAWQDRTLFLQWHRGDEPEAFRNFAAVEERWKLLRPDAPDSPIELYDLSADPEETTNLAANQPDVVARLKRAYEEWFADVGSTRPDNYDPPAIRIGTPHEDPTVLTRQDLRRIGPEQGWNGEGYWQVQVSATGRYDVALRFSAPVATDAMLRFAVGDVVAESRVKTGATTATFDNLELSASPARLSASLNDPAAKANVFQLEIGTSR